MVFENIVADLVNRFLGDFVENLDKSQLSIGIWGGDVVLENIFIKDSALDDLDLPVKLLSGSFTKLTLKIPWKNLYTAPVVATIEGLNVLVVPNKGVKYDAEKEEKYALEAKQKQLQAIEDARLKKLEATSSETKPEKQDTFAEKLATQVIKNLQVTIQDIHFRFEDKFTNPKSPFSLGVTLHSLNFQTTDEHWKPSVITETVTMIYKLVQLDSLALYWNSNTKCLSDMPRAQMLQAMKHLIGTTENKTDLQYIINPINSSAQLTLNTKPGQSGYSIPKILLNLVLEEIALGLNRNQYLDLMEFLEGLERLQRSMLYRKYRPQVPLRENVKMWWHFAMNAVMEEDIKPRSIRNSWEQIIKHRRLCKKYQAVFKKKLQSKKVSVDLQKELDLCEQELDILNITMMRHQARLEVEKEDIKAKEEKKGGWFSGWFGSGKKEAKAVKSTTEDIAEKFGEAMTVEERAKLYEAIGYSENLVDETFPKEFVAVKARFRLNTLSVCLRDLSRKDAHIVKLVLKTVVADFGQRPSAQAIKVETNMETFTVYGAPAAGGHMPYLFKSENLDQDKIVHPLLKALFETNPLDGECDQRVRVDARPAEIIYDANTINLIAAFFEPPESVHLAKIQAAVVTQLQDLQEMSASGLRDAIKNRKYVDIDVNMMASHLIIPENGLYKEVFAHNLVVDLGSVHVSSMKHEPMLIRKESSSDEVMDELLKHSYDMFDIHLSKIQIIFTAPDEDWRSVRDIGNSKMHILQPFDLNIHLHKGIVMNDPRLPKMRVIGDLPALTINVSDYKLQKLACLAVSIPLPESPPQEALPFDDTPEVQADSEREAERVITKGFQPSLEEVGEDEESWKEKKEQLTDLELKFELQEFNITISKCVDMNEVALLYFGITSVGAKLQMRSFDMKADAFVGAVVLQHMQFNDESGSPVCLLGSPAVEQECPLLAATYVKADRRGPDFATRYKNVEQNISVKFSSLGLLLHQEALLHIKEIGEDFSSKLTETFAKKDGTRKEDAEQTQSTSKKSTSTVKLVSTTSSAGAVSLSDVRRKRIEEIIDVKLEADLDTVSIVLCNRERTFTAVKVSGVNAEIAVQKEKTAVCASLKGITVTDPTPDAIYPRIVSILDGELFNVSIALFSKVTSGSGYSNMDAVDTSISLNVGCICVVFLNRFVQDLLQYMDQFHPASVTEQISEASVAAMETATEIASDLHEKATRVQLKLNMKAPVIIIPQNSSCEEALLVDFGQLNIVNRFVLADEVNEVGIPAIIDKMLIELNQLKVTRAHMNKEASCCRPSAESLLVEPFNFCLELRRNLAAGWYHAIPEVDISGQLTMMNMTMCQGDFTLMMQVLNENLQEKPPPLPPKLGEPQLTQRELVEKSIMEGRTSTSETNLENKVQGKAEKVVKPIPKEIVPIATSVYEKVKFKFQFDKLGFILYFGHTEMQETIVKRNPSKALAKFELQVISAEGHVMSDNAIKAKVSLYNCILDDARAGREEGITRMLEARKIKEAGNQHHMIDFLFTQDTQENKLVDIKVHSFYICGDFLLTVSNFFTMGLPEPSKSTQSVLPSEKKSTISQKSSAPVDQPPTSDLDIKFAVENPEIVLVENALDKNTGALVLDTDISLHMRITPEVQQINGTVGQLQIMSCPFERDQREGQMKQVMNQVDITLFSNTPQGQGQKIDVNLTSVVITVSPATIRLISGIVSAMGEAEAPADISKAATNLTHLWEIKDLESQNLWFLQDTDFEASEQQEIIEDLEIVEPKGEQLLLNMNSIMVRVEAGVEARTVPMILLESSLSTEVREWSGNMEIVAMLTLEIAYYNERLATWEPLLEPVLPDGATKFRPWEASLKIEKNPPLPAPVSDSDTDLEIITTRPVLMSITLISMDMLQLTVSKTCLAVLTNLGKAFGDAVLLVESATPADFVDAACIVKNETGLDVEVAPDDSFQARGDSNMILRHGSVLPLIFKAQELQVESLRQLVEAFDRRVTVKIVKYDSARNIRIMKDEKRLFRLPEKSSTGLDWSFVSQVEVVDGQKIATIRSPVQIFNDLAISVEAFYQKGGTMIKIGTLSPGKVFNPSLEAVYADCNLFFKPLDEACSYKISNGCSWLKPLSDHVLLECKSESEGYASFYLSVTRETENVRLENTRDEEEEIFTLVLRPTAMLTNLLPYRICCTFPGTASEAVIEHGDTIPLYNACTDQCGMELRVMEYLNKNWQCKVELKADPDDLAVVTFATMNGNQKVMLEFGLHTIIVNNTQYISLYCPYWMVNKTGQTLYYQRGTEKGESSDAGIITHPPDMSEAVLFSFKPKSFFGKKKASLKIGDSDWSDKFSVDTVGSSGMVSCKNGKRTVEIGITNTLATSGLTKILIFTPFYMVVNKSNYDFQIREVMEGTAWIDILAGQCVPFFPEQTDSKNKQLEAKFKGQSETTAPFYCNKLHSTLLKLSNETGGISVDCQVNESSIIITLDEYFKGMAAVQIVNHTDTCNIEYNQKGVKSDLLTLPPKSVILYAWQDPLDLKRELQWSCGEKKNQTNSLLSDTVEEFFANSDMKVYFVSFLDGMQRVVMFTQDLVLATMAQQAGELEVADQEIQLSLQGLGISLVNDINRMEVSYLSISSSGVIWEIRKKRFKGMKLKDSEIVEKHYQKYIGEISEGKTPKAKHSMENKMEIDFAEMMMYKPKKCRVRRSFQHGIWLNLKQSVHSTQLHAKINKIQIDNQLPACVFSVVLAPIPPPKSVAAESVPKPFIEMSVMKRSVEHSDIPQIKYFKVLIQEMALKVDQGFINAMISLFTADTEHKVFDKDQMEVDKKLLETDLHEVLSTAVLTQGPKNYYDIMHFSPLKVHISFSQHGASGEKKKSVAFHTNVIGLLLKSVGVTLTEIQDVVFKLAYFERNNSFYTQPQIIHEATIHYTGQAIKQLYVLVLGLDVLGNPFGLITGVKEGVTDLFYEPIQGAVQGPEEFAEGLALGVRSLFGGVVGGAAGAVGRITGTLGKGLATLTLDDEYQRKRQEQLNKRPTDLTSGLAQGGKGLVMGVWDGVTGVVVKPVEGAKQEGAKGFFKGVGKGLIGVVARPTSGVVDFASTSLEGIRRATDMADEVRRYRPPRLIPVTGVLKPYRLREAEGYEVLRDVDKGKIAITDLYVAHLVLDPKDIKYILLVTDKRIVMVIRGEVFGQWTSDWQVGYDEFKDLPAVHDNHIKIIFAEPKKKKKGLGFGLFGGTSAGKSVTCPDMKSAHWIAGYINQAKQIWDGRCH